MNSEMAYTHFEVTWKRIKQITGWSDYKDLAGFIDSSPQSISGVKKRGKFPLEWARKIALEYGSSTDYIMDGEGEMKRMAIGLQGASSGAGVVREPLPDYGKRATDTDPVLSVVVQELSGMTTDQKRAVLKFCMDINGDQYALAKFSSQENREKRIKG